VLVFDWGDTVMRDFREYQGPMEAWPVVETMPGADTSLRSLSPHYALYLATNAADSDAAAVRRALARVGLDGVFADVFTSRDLGARKPFPAFFDAIARRARVAAANCVMIGNDYANDIAPAKAVGMRTVWLTARRDTADHDAADVVVANLDDLPAAIERLDGQPLGM
jgi:FMN phosphatase YigB (HAD superfamily)